MNSSKRCVRRPYDASTHAMQRVVVMPKIEVLKIVLESFALLLREPYQTGTGSPGPDESSADPEMSTERFSSTAVIQSRRQSAILVRSASVYGR